MLKRFNLSLIVPLLILVLGMGLRITDPPQVEQLRLLVFDQFQRWQPRAYVEAPVRILDIDDETLARLGQWPWPRTQVAHLVDRLTELGVGVIAFDIVFAEPDRTSPSLVLPLWQEGGEAERLKALAQSLPDHDQVLGKAIANSAVVAGFVLTDRPNQAKPAIKFGIANAGDDPKPFLPGYRGAVVNLPPIEAAAAGNGSFNQVPESDGLVRRAPLMLRLGDQVYPSLAAEALRVAQGASTYVLKASGASGELSFGAQTGLNHVKIGALEVPTDANGRIWAHYSRAAPGRTIPVWQVFEPNFDPARLADTIVYVGTSAAGLKDLRPTPLDPAAPGVEVHATVTEQMITGDYLQRPDWLPGAELGYLLVLGLGLIFLLPRWGSALCAVLAAVFMAAAFGASWWAYTGSGFLVDPVFPSLFVLAIYLASSLLVYLKTEAERRQVRGAFSRYMSPALVQQLADNPDKLRLGGETRNMTILFSDIRGFTGISEHFNASELTAVINRFLTPMTGIILERRGTIDKYMGDAIMAFWNAPLDDDAHAANACRAGLEMIRTLDRLNAQWESDAKAQGKPHYPIHVGVGLNTGNCCVGNMGSEQRFDYSVLGDDVNLASRLEGQSKTYHVDIVLGENTAAQVDEFATLEIDLIQVKGRAQPVHIFTLAGDERFKADPSYPALKDAHDRMMAAYRGQRWDEAEAALAEARGLAPPRLKGLYTLYAERIAQFRAEPPPADWNGVYVATSK